jgi:hypothetical protein
MAQDSSIDGDQNSALRIASHYGEFDTVKVLLAAGADKQILQWTELMEAIALGSLENVKALLNQGVDLCARDLSGRTPWLLSLQVGDLEKAQILLSSGANQEEVGEEGKTPLMYAIESGRTEVLKWLIKEGFDIEAADDYGNTALIVAAECDATECVSILLENGANPGRINKYNKKAINVASNLQIAQKLVSAGEDLSDINGEVRKLLIRAGQEDFSNLGVSLEQYLVGRYRRFGTTNPEIMEVDFWKAMVRCATSAYSAQTAFDDTEYNFDRFFAREDNFEPVWCNQRYGRTITQLPDGRIIEIGGAHEDYYDPDFCIYNDVVIYQGDGSFRIFGYPKEVFPPTDFHSATLVGNYIYIIGNLGYFRDRSYDETPVYQLDCDTLKIEKIEAIGEKPGWVSRHKAYYKEPAKIYVTGGEIGIMSSDKEEYIENLVDYTLDLISLRWSRIDA